MSKAQQRAIEELEGQVGNAMSVAHEAGRMVDRLDARVARMLEAMIAAGLMDPEETDLSGT